STLLLPQNVLNTRPDRLIVGAAADSCFLTTAGCVKFEYQIMRCLQPRVVHAMQLAGGKKHNPPRADVLLGGPDRPGDDDDRYIVLIEMGGISAARLQYGLVRTQLC